MGEEKRHQMMQNLFGDQSEEEEEVDSEHESNPHPNYASDEAEGAMEAEGEGEGEVEGHGEAEVESDSDLRDVEPDPGESEGEREQSSQEVDIGDQREESEAKDTDSDEKEEYGQRVVTSRRREVIESGSERSEENHYPDNEDEEVDQARSPSKSPGEKDQTHLSQSAAEIRDVFGDSDDEEAAEYAVRHEIEQDENRSPLEEEGSYGKSPRPEDMVHDEDAHYESDDEHIEVKQKEKPVGPPLELEVPLRPAPADPTKMNVIKVSNIMGIDPKPFDPKTYVEEDTFVTDESGSQKRIRLENNIVRWRSVRKKDGTISRESNARFVRWSDGSLQLLIGNEVLDISVQEAQHDQSHLFLRHGKGILQSQGRILRKMRFMPSSLTSNSHRLLTALVDSRHKKVYKVKNCVTDIDPEREKEEKEKAENQTIRANTLLNRKREKVNRKYTQNSDRKRPQLSTGYLEGALDEDDEMDYNDSRRSRRRFDEELEVEARSEKRIMNAKKGYKDFPRKSSFSNVKSSRRPIDFSESDREESEYETEGEEDEGSPHKRMEDEEPEYEEEEEEEEHDEEIDANRASEEEEEAEEPRKKVKQSVGSIKRKGIESDEDSPPRKAPAHRRMAVVYDSDEE
ncbi:Leo1-like protein [Corchorus capsularis]|uniref:Leo1-like protein n=1 Tax=Corchorus capsularis TaxID=210143 RepID=A0A1R3FZE7_COCAP|nr:Leo1-like protein [Corchorus capsularis]